MSLFIFIFIFSTPSLDYSALAAAPASLGPSPSTVPPPRDLSVHKRNHRISPPSRIRIIHGSSGVREGGGKTRIASDRSRSHQARTGPSSESSPNHSHTRSPSWIPNPTLPSTYSTSSTPTCSSLCCSLPQLTLDRAGAQEHEPRPSHQTMAFLFGKKKGAHGHREGAPNTGPITAPGGPSTTTPPSSLNNSLNSLQNSVGATSAIQDQQQRPAGASPPNNSSPMNSVPRSMGPLQQGPSDIGMSSPQQQPGSAPVQVRGFSLLTLVSSVGAPY